MKLKWTPIFGGAKATLPVGDITVTWTCAGGSEHRVTVFGRALPGTFSLKDGKAEAERTAAAWIKGSMRRIGRKAKRAAPKAA